MVEPHVHLAYAPRGPGLLYAVLQFHRAGAMYGWFVGSRDGEFVASYFALLDYYRPCDSAFYRSATDDVRGPWLQVTAGVESPAEAPLSEDMRRELARLQHEFIHHWLFFADDPAPEARAEAAALGELGLPVRGANIRAARLNKLRTAPAVWRYDSPTADINVLVELSQRWPLDERLEPDPRWGLGMRGSAAHP